MQDYGFMWSEVTTITGILRDKPFKGYVLTFTREK